MKTLLYTLLIIVFVSCEKQETVTPNAPLIKCGTLHITSDGGPFLYELGGSVISINRDVTHDTTFDIYENQLYRIYYKGTTIQSIDSVWFNPGGNWPNDSIFDRIDTTYDYHMIEHKTTTGSQSFEHILPSTIYDR